jgi:sortase A
VARLSFPRLGVQRTVLSGAAGSSLAFGLGHVSGTALPGEPGNCGIAGHRDSWASFLRDLRIGDDVRLETRAGSKEYRVAGIDVVPKERAAVLDPTAGRRLTLVTCWPFTGLLHSPWRYVVTCEASES